MFTVMSVELLDSAHADGKPTILPNICQKRHTSILNKTLNTNQIARLDHRTATQRYSDPIHLSSVVILVYCIQALEQEGYEQHDMD